jgi:hypothetical protein
VASAAAPPPQDAQQAPKRELFDGDGLTPSRPIGGGGSKVYSGGARSGKVKVGQRAVEACRMPGGKGDFVAAPSHAASAAA